MNTKWDSASDLMSSKLLVCRFHQFQWCYSQLDWDEQEVYMKEDPGKKSLLEHQNNTYTIQNIDIFKPEYSVTEGLQN